MTTSVEVKSLESAALHYREAGKLAQALPLYAQAASLAEPELPDEASKFWSNAGVCALHVFQADTAVRYFRNALDLVSPDHPDRHARLARLYANLTAACYQASRMSEAWDAGRQSLLLAEETASPRAVGNALYNLGLAERYLGAFDEALKLFAAARRAYQGASAPLLAADALHNIGWVRLDRLEVEEAETALRQARDERTTLCEPVTRIDIELARLSLVRGRQAEALTGALRAIEAPESLTDPVTRLQALLVAADATRVDDLAAALEYAGVALDLALTLGRPPILLDLMPLVVRVRAEADLSLKAEEQDLARELYARRHGTFAADRRKAADEVLSPRG